MKDIKNSDKYKFTKENMPIIYEAGRVFLEKTDKKIAIGLPLTWETLSFIDAIRDKVPNLMVIPQSFGENSSTQAGVFNYLDKWGIKYFTKKEDRIKLLEEKPDVIIDCSFELGITAVENNLLDPKTIIIEDTKTGENRMQELDFKNKSLVIDNSPIKRNYENRFGIGYSVIASLMSMGLFLPKYKIGVIGFGFVGKGVAEFADLMGSKVYVSEIDEERAKEAGLKYTVLDKKELLETVDIVITAAGVNVLNKKDFENLNKTIILANAGGEDEWIREEMFYGLVPEKIHPYIEEYKVGKSIIREVAGANSVNLATGVAMSEFLDLTFSYLVFVLSQIDKTNLKNGINQIDVLNNELFEEKIKTIDEYNKLTLTLKQYINY